MTNLHLLLFHTACMELQKGDAKIKVHGVTKTNAKRVFRKFVKMERESRQDPILVVKFPTPLTVKNMTLSHQYTPTISVTVNTDTEVTQVSVYHPLTSVHTHHQCHC